MLRMNFVIMVAIILMIALVEMAVGQEEVTLVSENLVNTAFVTGCFIGFCLGLVVMMGIERQVDKQ